MKKSKGKKIEHWTPLGIFGLFCTILITVIAVFPFIYMFLMSFTESRTLKLHLNEVDFTNLENFAYIFKNSGFLQAFINSVVVVIASCALNVVISCMAAYGFEKKLFPGRKFIFQIYMISLMIPGQVTMPRPEPEYGCTRVRALRCGRTSTMILMWNLGPVTC